MKKLIIGSMLTVFCSVSFADNVVNTQTNTWKSIPITVDADKHTYTAGKGFLVPEGNYYYTYSGYRCLVTKIEKAELEPFVLKSSDKGSDIYCYPEH